MSEHKFQLGDYVRCTITKPHRDWMKLDEGVVITLFDGHSGQPAAEIRLGDIDCAYYEHHLELIHLPMVGADEYEEILAAQELML